MSAIDRDDPRRKGLCKTCRHLWADHTWHGPCHAEAAGQPYGYCPCRQPKGEASGFELPAA